MPTKNFLTGCFLFLLAGTFGCAATGGETAGDDRYYLNANLGFAIEHPADWLRARDVDDPTEVKWTGPADKKRRQPSTLLISAYPSSGETAAGLAERYLAGQSDLVITGRQDVRLPAAAGHKLLGSRPGRDFLVYLLATDPGAYILEFSAGPEDFAADRSFFEAMAHSFRILAPPTAPAPPASGK